MDQMSFLFLVVFFTCLVGGSYTGGLITQIIRWRPIISPLLLIFNGILWTIFMCVLLLMAAGLLGR